MTDRPRSGVSDDDTFPQRSRPPVARTVVALGTATAVLLGIVALSHRHFNRAMPMQRLQRFADMIQPTVDSTGRLPDLSRWVDGEWADTITHQADAWARRYAADTGEAIIAAAGALCMPLSQAGRPVLIYADGRLEVVWMAESVFQERIETQRRKIKANRARARGDAASRSPDR